MDSSGSRLLRFRWGHDRCTAGIAWLCGPAHAVRVGPFTPPPLRSLGRLLPRNPPSRAGRPLSARGSATALSDTTGTYTRASRWTFRRGPFNPEDRTSNFLKTMAIFAVGFVARIFGGVVFVWLGDRVIRKSRAPWPSCAPRSALS